MTFIDFPAKDLCKPPKRFGANLNAYLKTPNELHKRAGMSQGVLIIIISSVSVACVGVLVLM